MATQIVSKYGPSLPFSLDLFLVETLYFMMKSRQVSVERPLFPEPVSPPTTDHHYRLLKATTSLPRPLVAYQRFEYGFILIEELI